MNQNFKNLVSLSFLAHRFFMHCRAMFLSFKESGTAYIKWNRGCRIVTNRKRTLLPVLKRNLRKQLSPQGRTKGSTTIPCWYARKHFLVCRAQLPLPIGFSSPNLVYAGTHCSRPLRDRARDIQGHLVTDQGGTRPHV